MVCMWIVFIVRQTYKHTNSLISHTMLNKSVRVSLREQKNKSGRSSLFLDFYPPIYDEKKKKETRRKFLDLFVFEKPANKAEKDHNKYTMLKAKQTESEYQFDFLSKTLDMPFISHKDADFLEYFKSVVKKRYSSKGNYDNWLSTYNYLNLFTGGNCIVSQVTEQFCQNFKDFLDQTYSIKSEAYKLSANSKYSYFNKFRAGVKQAYEDKVLLENPLRRIKAFPQAESYREFLTLEEVKMLKETPCDNPVLFKAAMWSIRTGLRWSDVVKLRWSDIQFTENTGYFIRFEQTKTKTQETLPISEQAYLELGTPVENKLSLVFKGLKYSAHNNNLISKWVLKAGIHKKITFHNFRHTNATLLLSAGEDIYTVSKMLGHQHLKTTEIYAKVINTKKIDAANKINF
jgi:integrase